MNAIVRISFCVVLAACCVVLLPGAARAGLQMPPHLVTGHGEVDVPYVNGQWDMKVIDATSGDEVEYAADEALFHLNENTAIATSSIPASCYGWLGTTSGQTIYVVPQNPKADTAYFCFSLEGMTQADKDALAAWEPTDPRVDRLHHDHDGVIAGGDLDAEAEAWIRIDLLSVRGLDGTAAPGEFSLWTADDEGIVVWMSTAQTPVDGNAFYLDVEHGHSHVNWGFTEPGVYEIEFQASTYLGADPATLVTSPATTYYFGVLAVPEPATIALLGSAVGIVLTSGRGRARAVRARA